jgi:glyoxylase I family protein
MKNHSIFLRLHHGSLIVGDLASSLYFYCHVIGLEQNLQRPEMSFDGAWLDIGEQQIHLLKLPQTEQPINTPEHAGRDRHLAIHVTSIDSIKAGLEEKKWPFTMSHSGREALFCRDPDGNGLEFIKVGCFVKKV